MLRTWTFKNYISVLIFMKKTPLTWKLCILGTKKQVSFIVTISFSKNVAEKSSSIFAADFKSMYNVDHSSLCLTSSLF